MRTHSAYSTQRAADKLKCIALRWCVPVQSDGRDAHIVTYLNALCAVFGERERCLWAFI